MGRESTSVEARDCSFLSHAKLIFGVPPSKSEAVAEHVSVLSGVMLSTGSMASVSTVGFVLVIVADVISLTEIVPSSKVTIQLIISSGSTTPTCRLMVFVLPIMSPLWLLHSYVSVTTSSSRSTYSTEHINVSDVLNVSPVMVRNWISGAEFPLDFSVSPEQATSNTVEMVTKRIVNLTY